MSRHRECATPQDSTTIQHSSERHERYCYGLLSNLYAK